MENPQIVKKSKTGLLIGIISSIVLTIALIVTTVIILNSGEKSKSSPSQKQTEDTPVSGSESTLDISATEPKQALQQALRFSLEKLTSGSISQTPPATYNDMSVSVNIKQIAPALAGTLGSNLNNLSLSVDCSGTADASVSRINILKNNSALAGMEVFTDGDRIIIGSPAGTDGIINGYYSINTKTIAQDFKGSAFEKMLKELGIDPDDMTGYFENFKTSGNQAAGISSSITFMNNLENFISDNKELLEKADVEKVKTNGNLTTYRVKYSSRDIRELFTELMTGMEDLFSQAAVPFPDEISPDDISGDISLDISIDNDLNIRGFEIIFDKGSISFKQNISEKDIDVTLSLEDKEADETFSMEIKGTFDISPSKANITIDNFTVKSNDETLAVIGMKISAKDTSPNIKIPKAKDLFSLTEDEIMTLTQDMNLNIVSIMTSLRMSAYSGNADYAD